VAAVALLLVVPACSGSDAGGSTGTSSPANAGIPVRTWAGEACDAISGWIDDLDAAVARTGAILRRTDPANGRRAIVDLFTLASERTGGVTRHLDVLEPPRIPDGPELVAQIQARFRRFDRVMLAARAEALRLPARDAKALETGLVRLVNRFEAALVAVADTFDDLDAAHPSPRLAAAWSAACHR
jgi:hypothetical protein